MLTTAVCMVLLCVLAAEVFPIGGTHCSSITGKKLPKKCYEDDMLDIPTVIALVKFCLSLKPLSKLRQPCFHEQNGGATATTFVKQLGISSTMKKFDFSLDHQGLFCYSYDVEISDGFIFEHKISKCVPIEDLINDLLLWMLSLSQPENVAFPAILHTDNLQSQNDCAVAFLVETTVCIISTLLTAVVFAIWYIKSRDRTISVKSKNLKVSIVDRPGNFTKYARYLYMNLFKRFLTTCRGNRQKRLKRCLFAAYFGLADKTHSFRGLDGQMRFTFHKFLVKISTKALQSIITGYTHVAENGFSHRLAESFIPKLDRKLLDENLYTCVSKMAVARAISQVRCGRSRKVKGRLRQKNFARLLRDYLSDCSSVMITDCLYDSAGERFEVVSHDVLLNSQSTLLSTVSSSQHVKTQPLSQWDINNTNLMYDRSPSCESQGLPNEDGKKFFSSWSTSSYEVVPLPSSSERDEITQESDIREQPQVASCLSITPSSSCDDSSSSSLASGSGSNKVIPGSFIPLSYISSDSATSSHSANKSAETLSKHRSLEAEQPDLNIRFNSTVVNNPWPTKKRSRCIECSAKGVPKNSEGLGKSSLSSTYLLKKPLSSIHQQAIPPETEGNAEKWFHEQSACDASGFEIAGGAEKCGLPIIQDDYPCKNIWGKTNVPVLNSMKKSFLTESSFDFDDSRFNSPSSTDTHYFEKQLGDLLRNRPDSNPNRLYNFSPIFNLDCSNNYQHLCPSPNMPKAYGNQNFLEPSIQVSTTFMDAYQATTTVLNEGCANPLQKKTGRNNRRNSLREIIQIFKSRRDELDRLKAQVSRDSIIIGEYQTILQEIVRENAIKSESIKKQSAERLRKLQEEELIHCNHILDKEIIKLYNLQRRYSHVKAREFKLRSRLQWEPVEIYT